MAGLLLQTPTQMTAAALAVLRFARADASPTAKPLRPADAATPDILKAATLLTGALRAPCIDHTKSLAYC